MAEKGKLEERNWISSDSSTEQPHRDKLCQSKNRQDIKNSECRLCGDRDEMINHLISECSKLAQKENKTWYDRVIHWESCKKFKFDHTNKCYMHNPESIVKNETQISPGFLDINRSSNLLHTTRSTDSQQKKITCRIVDFAVPADHRVKLKKKAERELVVGVLWHINLCRLFNA